MSPDEAITYFVLSNSSKKSLEDMLLDVKKNKGCVSEDGKTFAFKKQDAPMEFHGKVAYPV